MPGPIMGPVQPFPAMHSPAHSTDRTNLLAVCLQTASPPLTRWPRPAQVLRGDMAATSQPCLDVTTEPRARGCSLRLHLSNVGMPKSLPEAEQRSRVRPGKKPEQSAAEFVLGGVCSEHSLGRCCAHHPLCNSSRTVGIPSLTTPPRTVPWAWDIAHPLP